MVIAAVAPRLVGDCSGALRGVVVGVDPLEREGAVEAFDVAVGLRTVGQGTAVDDVAEGGVEQRRAAAGPVVAEHPLTVIPSDSY